jgi:hypothetical protein
LIERELINGTTNSCHHVAELVVDNKLKVALVSWGKRSAVEVRAAGKPT